MDSADEAEEFRVFVRTHSPALIRSAYLLTGDQHLAEDLLQNVLIRVARRWRTIATDGPIAVAAYVRRGVYREYLSWRRIRRNAERPAEVLPERGLPDPSERIVLHLTLRRALLRLPPRQRAVITLRYYEDLSEADTAQLLGCSVGTVKSQTSRALRRLAALVPDLADCLAEVPEPAGPAGREKTR